MLKTFPSAVMSAVLKSTIFSVNEGQVSTDATRERSTSEGQRPHDDAGSVQYLATGLVEVDGRPDGATLAV